MTQNSARNRMTERIWTRRWTDEQLTKMIGQIEACYFAYAAEPEVRELVASGGAVTALLLSLLAKDQIDGALVCQTMIIEGQVRPQFIIATDKESLLQTRGSKYTAVHFNRDALPMIEAFQGRLAVVALPCDIKNFVTYRKNHPAIDAKIALMIALVCGHNSEPALVDMITRKLGKGRGELTSFIYRRGKWRGEMVAEFLDGSQVVKPTSHFTNYQNLYYFAEEKCRHCFDHTGYYADLSAGDIWSPRMRENPIKHTALLARTGHANDIIQASLADATLIGTEEDITEFADGQARSMRSHYNISARVRAGKLMGIQIKDSTSEKVGIVDWLIAFLRLANDAFSHTKVGSRIIRLTPMPLIRLYLLLFKGLESL